MVEGGAADLSKAARAGELSAVEIAEAALARIDSLDADLSAFITVAAEQALGHARAADARRAGGEELGALHAVPIGIKDLVATRGMRTTSGSRIFRDHVPDEDDVVVARLRDAGAIVVGKTNVPEFGFGAVTDNELCGPTRNPYDRRRTSGGSSGGSAVAVAAGMVPVAHGTDFGGSVRTPASFCGVVGLRPTPGVVPSAAKRLPWDAIHLHGAIARSVEDAFLVLRAMSGGHPLDPVSGGRSPLPAVDFDRLAPVGYRVAASVDLGIATIDAEVADVCARAFERTANLDPVRVEEDHPDCSGAQEAFETIRAAMLYDSLGEYVESGFDDLSETVSWNAERGRATTGEALLRAERERGLLYRRFVEFFDRYDVLATPTTSVAPFRVEQTNVSEINGLRLRNIVDYLTITYVISLVGCPAISVPCGNTGDGLPVGLQLVARPGDERRLVKFAHLLQEQAGCRHRPPAGLG